MLRILAKALFVLFFYIFKKVMSILYIIGGQNINKEAVGA